MPIFTPVTMFIATKQLKLILSILACGLIFANANANANANFKQPQLPINEQTTSIKILEKIEAEATIPNINTSTENTECLIRSYSQVASEAQTLGEQVIAIEKVMNNPHHPDALKIITELGYDQRYYTMVRGWLSMQLAGDKSILSANSENEKIAFRVNILEKALAAIDLE